MSNEPQHVPNASPYAGRWVARLQGKIIAQGGTPEQARLAAQKTRYKEKPEIHYMPTVFPFPFSSLINRVQAVLSDMDVYLVGGMVRDALLGRQSHDFDFALPHNAIDSARRVAAAFHADFYVLDEGFDTARVILSTEAGEREILDFAAFRGADLEADLRGRDFTINALAFDLRTETILDPLNGATDIRSKIIRACSQTSLQDDPIRILRAIRQAALLEFKIDPETRKAMKQAANLLPSISPERQRDELFKILDGQNPNKAMRALEIIGVFPYMLPELSPMKGMEQSEPHLQDVWEHTLSVIKYLEGILTVLTPVYKAEETNDLFTGLLTQRLGRYREKFTSHFNQPLNADRTVRSLLFFAVLYHDVSKPATRSVDETGRIRFIGHEVKGAGVAHERARSLNLSNNEIERLEPIITNHMRFHFFTKKLQDENKEPSRRAIYRFYRDTGEAGIDLVLLGLADVRGIHEHTLTQETWKAALDVARILLENYWEKPEEIVSPPRLLDGNEVMAKFNLKQSPLIGRILEAIREAQATGEISTKEEALAFSGEWLKENRN
jgi:tRNA nucleotidyltransferase/poly(A) polymerase